MATPQTTIKSLYRRLLRELPVRAPSHPTARSAHQKLSTPSPLQQRIRSHLSSTNSSTSSEASQIQQAEELVRYFQAQRMYATLIERYNPGMGMSEEERVRLSARRVGMDLPVEVKGQEEKS